MNAKFLAPAQVEVAEIITYYNQQRAGLGREFVLELKQTLTRIRNYPMAWSPLSSRVRRCRVNRFPYSVIYEVRSDALIIAAIQHHNKEPNSWRNRML
jgi:ParE toxin of type II toxin-antitoxin system, parDE